MSDRSESQGQYRCQDDLASGLQEYTALDQAPSARRSPPLGSAFPSVQFPTSHYRDELRSRNRAGPYSRGASNSTVNTDMPHRSSNLDTRRGDTQPTVLTEPNETQRMSSVDDEHYNVQGAANSDDLNKMHASKENGVQPPPQLKRTPSLYEDFKRNVYERLHIFGE